MTRTDNATPGGIPVVTHATACALAFALSACGGGGPSGQLADGAAVPPPPDAPTPDAPVPDAPPVPDAMPIPDAPEVDCLAQQPEFPLQYTELNGFTDSEDFAFDAEGYLVSTDRSDNLTRQPRSGPRSLFVPNIGSTAGTAFLATGDLMVANVGQDSLVRVYTNGARQTVLSGLSYPNGITVGLDGMVYVAEHNAGNVRRVDPDTGAFDIVASGLQNPNGLSFSPDYRRLYIGSFGGGTVHFVPFDESGNAQPVELLGDMPAGVGGGLDGVGVDACGFVYVTVFVDGEIWRFPPEGGVPELVVELPSFWIPNLHWGTGIGGWEQDQLYVIERDAGRVFELHLGIPGIPRVYP